MYLFSVVLLMMSVILIFVLLRIRNSRHKKAGFRSLAAIDEFNSISNPRISCSEEKISEFLQKYKDAASRSENILHSPWISKSFKEKFQFKQFIELYRNAYAIHERNESLYNAIAVVNGQLLDSYASLRKINDHSSYQSYHLIERFKLSSEQLVQAIARLQRAGFLHCVENEQSSLNFMSDYRLTIQDENITRHNEDFVETEKIRLSSMFDTCLQYPLDTQQREAILHLEDNTLVISSAGSGKTSTMVGKAIYLSNEVKIPTPKILVITYTRKAASELSERLNIDGLSCSTFHALALKIIGELTDHTPSICGPDFMLNCLYRLMREDMNFMSSINSYLIEMRSLMRLEHEYDEAREYYGDRKKYGKQALFKDMRGNMIFTKSEEERRISEWLSMHGINFVYEEPYEVPTSDNIYRQYKPDFSIYYTDSEGRKKRIYLEHYAIDSNHNVPKWFGTDYNATDQSYQARYARWETANLKYNEAIVWKQNLHKENGTELIYTTSAMFHDKSIWNLLERSLKMHGVPVSQMTPTEMYDKMVQRNRSLEHSIFTLIEQFTTLYKSNLGDWNQLNTIAKDHDDQRSSFILNNIMKPFYVYYNQQLKASDQIDFTDAILLASELCRKIGWRDFDYILVDEFQDISKDRYMFLQSLRKDTDNCFTKLFCVGDDWQSIYRFSGSDMALFYDFKKYFGYTRECKIETTYRFREPLIDFSSKFIQANPEQKRKAVKENELPDNQLPVQTDLELYSYKTDEDEKRQIENIIRTIPRNETVLIIGRYNYNCHSLGMDFYKINPEKSTLLLNIGGRQVKFMSIHASKGLEADHVFLINCNSGINGFPSLIEDDPVLNLVLSEQDHFDNAEERRVFYVAITRAKKKMYVFYDENRPSPFLSEVRSDDSLTEQKLIPCPICGNGYIHKLKEGTSGYGKWVLLSCTNSTGGCPYFKIMSESDFSKM